MRLLVVLTFSMIWARGECSSWAIAKPVASRATAAAVTVRTVHFRFIIENSWGHGGATRGGGMDDPEGAWGPARGRASTQ